MLSTLIIDDLTAERKRQGLSLGQVAKKGGFSKSSLHEWEHGKKMPSLFNAVHWAIALDVEMLIRSNRMNHTLVSVSVESDTRGTYLCSCGAEGTTTMANHLASPEAIRARATKNHELHQVRALRDGGKFTC